LPLSGLLSLCFEKAETFVLFDPSSQFVKKVLRSAFEPDFFQYLNCLAKETQLVPTRRTVL
jgi:hypothetical protein